MKCFLLWVKLLVIVSVYKLNKTRSRFHQNFAKPVHYLDCVRVMWPTGIWHYLADDAHEKLKSFYFVENCLNFCSNLWWCDLCVMVDYAAWNCTEFRYYCATGFFIHCHTRFGFKILKILFSDVSLWLKKMVTSVHFDIWPLYTIFWTILVLIFL